MDIETTVEQIASTANKVPEMQAMLKGWDRIVALEIDEATYALISEAQEVRVQKGPVENADLSFKMAAETLEAIVTGQTTPLAAKLGGKIASTGRLTDILKFVSLLKMALDAAPGK